MLSIHITLTEAVKQVVSDNARLDAEVLLCHVLGVKRSYLLAWSNKALTPHQYEQFRTLWVRRIAGEPVAYIVGKKEFWSLELQVNASVLIPRPDTELLVEQVLQRLPKDSALPILDMGTGSGAIALAIAYERPQCQVLAIDNSVEALAVASHNAQQLGIRNVEFLYSDWFASLNQIRMALIVTNPPYVAEDDPHLLCGDVRYEPRNALVAGKDGLVALQYLISHAPTYLSKSGWLLVEHGCEQAHVVREQFTIHHYKRVITYHDLAGLPRVTVGHT